MVRGGRDEAGLQPSEDQFWPLPWGVDVTSVAAKKQCGMELKVLPRRGKAGSRPSEYQFWPLPWGVRCGKEEVLGCDLQAVGILSDIEFQGLYTPGVKGKTIALCSKCQRAKRLIQ